MRQIKLRVDQKLYERIIKDAKQQKRSVSAQVAFVVERAMEPEKVEARR